MDTIYQLGNAFAKVIVSYYNTKLPTKITDIDTFVKNEDAIEAIEGCISDVIKVESSRDRHLALFKHVFYILRALHLDHKPSKPEDRAALRQEIIGLLIKLYQLNHDGYAHTIDFSGVPYELSSTRSWFLKVYQLTELGKAIRNHILIPIGASGISASDVETIISNKIVAMFEKFVAQEEQESKAAAGQVRLEAQLMKLSDVARDSARAVSDESDQASALSPQLAASSEEPRGIGIAASVSPTTAGRNGFFYDSTGDTHTPGSRTEQSWRVLEHWM